MVDAIHRSIHRSRGRGVIITPGPLLVLQDLSGSFGQCPGELVLAPAARCASCHIVGAGTVSVHPIVGVRTVPFRRSFAEIVLYTLEITSPGKGETPVSFHLKP